MGLKSVLGNAVNGVADAAGGILNAGVSAVTGSLSNQWKEFFYCDSISEKYLMVRGHKRTSSKSSNKGDDNIITNGSVIAVADGQCMLIVDQGKVADLCAVPGEYIYDQSSEPSIFTGNLGDSIKETFKNIGKRFTFGGDSGKEQRVYYINTKELYGNPYGTPKKIPFRVVDERAGIDIDISIGCFGEYSYRVCDPIAFYTNVASNVPEVFERSKIDSQLKSEIMTSLQPAFGKLSAQGIRYSALTLHTEDIANALNEVLSDKWGHRGLEVVSFGISSMTADEEDEKMIKEMQKQAAYTDPTRLAAYAGVAQADALKIAAGNTSAGPMMAFMGMNAAQNAAGGGIDINGLMAQGQAMRQQQAAAAPAAPAAAPAPAADTWTCSCGATVSGNFCPECGAKKPAPAPAAAGWTCPDCGAVNQGRFCTNCGAKKPAGAPQYKCDKCGWTPADPKNPPKFCPECGDPFGDEDIVQ